MATDISTVISALEYCAAGTKPCDRCPMKNECFGNANRAMAAAAAILRKQIPIKPILKSDMRFCGSCKFALASMWNYCPSCGKEILWNE